jgi:AcrR family transcriptional regulator
MARGASSAPARKPAHRYHHGNLERALLEAALRTIQRDGVDGLTLRGVGHDVGVSRTALYRHFADKAALLRAVAREGFRTLRIALVAAWKRKGRGRPGFAAMGEAYVRFAVANPSHYRVMFGALIEGAAADPELALEGAGAFQALVDAIVEQQQAGLVRPDDPQVFAEYIWSLVHGIAMLAIDGRLGRKSTHVVALTRYAIERTHTGIAN